jgi:predicted phosphodiesterase
MSTQKVIGVFNPNASVPVQIFPSIREAARVLNLDRTAISKNLNGHSNSCGGFVFKTLSIGEAKYDESLEAPKDIPPYIGNPKNVLVIGDTHEPFCRPGYREFCREIQERFDCGTVVHIGDEVDNHAISFHTPDPDGMSAGTEADKALAAMKKWYETFPNVKVIVGNHSALPFRRAKAHGIASVFMKPYAQLWSAPSGWEWVLNYEQDGVLYTHGTGTSGPNAALAKAQSFRKNIVQGHLHTVANVQWSASSMDKVFGMQVGCGVDQTSYAMAYTQDWNKKFIVSCGVVLDGKLPIVIPMDL